MKTELNLQEKPLSWLRPAEYNPRVRLQPGDPEFEKIRRSIETFGYVDPIIANSDGTIIGGHQRFFVLQELGYEATQVVITDLNKDQEKALNIALNKISGEWDEEKLYELLLELDLSDLDMQLTGFSHSELEDLQIKFDDLEASEDEDFDPEAAEEEARKDTRSFRGCVWLLGEHRVMCGDATDPEDVAKLMAGDQADLVITDPPYNVDYGSKVNSMPGYFKNQSRGDMDYIKDDNMDDESFYAFLFDAYKNMNEASRNGAAIYVFHADSFSHIFREAFMEAGYKLAQCLIWEKNKFVLGRQDYQWRHEPILYGWKEGAGHYFINDRSQDTIILEDELDFESMKKSELVAYIEEFRKSYADQTSVIYENKPVRSDVHPTMKPVSLIGRLMKNSSRQEWLIFDPFGGSGTTLIAAEQLNRTAYLMELDEVFCDVIVKRWEEYTGKTAIMEE